MTFLIACMIILGPAQPMWAAPGSLDTNFGNGGRVLTGFAQESSDSAFAVVIQPDGKMLAAGLSDANGNLDFALARYNVDGTLDGSFGAAGKVLTDFSQASDDQGFAVALQPDGKIVVAGLSKSSFALARYTPNGTLDATFGSGGLVTTTFGNGRFDEALAIAIQPDGKIVAVGLSDDANGNFDFALARYNANGTLDSTFGSGGKVLTDFSQGSFDEAFAVAIQPDGKIVVAGLSDAGGGNFNFALARYDPNGTLDGSFGAAGKVLTNFSPGSDDEAFAVALQPDGRIVAAGQSGSSFALARYDANGTLDAGFGTGGTVTTAFGAETLDRAAAVAIQPDGKIVVGGSSDNLFALARYDANGALDAGFGSGGKVTTAFGTASVDQATAMAVQSDGKFVLVGSSDAGGSSDFAVARYLVASTPPGPVLEVHTNGVAFTSGSPFQLDLVVGNSGAETNLDFYFGVLLPPSVGGCPNNDPILFFAGGFSNFVVTCLSASSPNIVPFAPGVSLPALPPTTLAKFLEFVWSDGFPTGAYTFFVAAADAGTLNIRTLGIDTVTFNR